MPLVKILIAVVALIVAAACGLGFLAAGEPPGYPTWQAAYAAVSSLCVLAALLLLLSAWRASRSASSSRRLP